VKYGSLSCPNGQVFVDWQVEGDGNNILLTWREHGGPIVSPPNKQGFGHQLIDTCIKSLSGAKQEEFAPDGYTCTLTFKVADVSLRNFQPITVYSDAKGVTQLTRKGAIP